jgi:hypothetical protein
MPHRLSALLRQEGYWTTRDNWHCFAAPSNGSHWPPSKGSFKRFNGEEWEMFNSTDEVWPP